MRFIKNSQQQRRTSSKLFLFVIGLLAGTALVPAAAYAAKAEPTPTPTPTPAATPTMVGNLGLKEAVEISLKTYPSLKQSEEIIHQYDSQVPVIRANIFPVVTANGVAETQKAANQGINTTGNPAFGGTAYNTYMAGLKAVQPLFVYGSLSAIDSAKLDVKNKHLDAEIAARTLTSQVISAYYQIVLDVRNVDTLVRNERIQEEALVTSERRARTGRGQVLDVLQAKTQLALLKSQISSAQNQVQIDIATLANYMGNLSMDRVRVKDHLEAPEVAEVDRIVDLKSFRLPELEENRNEIAQIEDGKDSTLGQSLPVVSLQADYDYNAFTQAEILDQDNNSWDVMLNISVPLFSGFSSFYQQQVLNSQKMQLEYSRQNIVNTTNTGQVTSRKLLETAQETILQGRQALKLAVASSDEARRMYQLATIDFLQLLTIEQAYVQAEQSLNSYKFTYVAALASYFINSGQKLESLVDLLERSSQ